MRKNREIPEGFVRDAAMMGYPALMKKYHACRETVIEWREALGVPVVRGRKPLRVEKVNPDNGEVVAVYASVKDVANECCVGESLMREICQSSKKGIPLIMRGYVWRYQGRYQE